jgi:hypothetical protein
VPPKNGDWSSGDRNMVNGQPPLRWVIIWWASW